MLKQECECFLIEAQQGLDPITVVLQDLGPNQGKIIVECYGLSWSTFWGGMSGKTVRDFVAASDSFYLASRFWRVGQRRTKQSEQYLERICKAVIQAMKPE